MDVSSSYARPKPAGGLELWSWLFMRVSGLALLLLALGHLVLMHLIHNVDEINYAFVAGRYAGWFWRGYDLLMLILAMLHGVNGARILIDDYIHPPGWRRLALRAPADEFVAFCQRFRDSGQKIEGPVDHEKAWSAYFTDPWGNLLEVTTYDYAEVPRLLPA